MPNTPWRFWNSLNRGGGVYCDVNFSIHRFPYKIVILPNFTIFFTTFQKNHPQNRGGVYRVGSRKIGKLALNRGGVWHELNGTFFCRRQFQNDIFLFSKKVAFDTYQSPDGILYLYAQGIVAEQRSYQRYRIFFFPGKVCALLTNSFSDKTRFFFEEKKTVVFFSLEKFDMDSLVIQLTLVNIFP